MPELRVEYTIGRKQPPFSDADISVLQECIRYTFASRNDITIGGGIRRYLRIDKVTDWLWTQLWRIPWLREEV